MNSTGRVETWVHLAIGATIFLGVAAAFDFMDSNAGLAAGTQALHSVAFALKLLVGAAVGAGIVWFGLRTIRGADGAPDVKDALLWNTFLIGAVVTALRMFS
jgi:hypothetical protein